MAILNSDSWEMNIVLTNSINVYTKWSHQGICASFQASFALRLFSYDVVSC